MREKGKRLYFVVSPAIKPSQWHREALMTVSEQPSLDIHHYAEIIHRSMASRRSVNHHGGTKITPALFRRISRVCDNRRATIYVPFVPNNVISLDISLAKGFGRGFIMLISDGKYFTLNA